ncbi:hypothetical protein [Actinocorallia populi]|uniref:hypothetical protein n=1 Tax=Actinocorallia populi TaxID=2079200 RepID=UPI0013009914|nr:hypothetical protein [Actinocorallia populi]
MAEKWVETTVEGFEAWAATRGGADLHGARILVELADLNRTAELDGELLREILLEDFPENVVAGPDDGPAVLGAARDLVAYLAEGGELDGARVRELEGVLDTVGPEFTEALEASAENDGNAAELFLRMMAADGVDPDDEAAVEAWAREFEALSDEEKLERTMRQFAADNVVPPVRLAPRAELAAAARASALLTGALELASWADGRALEEDRLTEDDVKAAAAALGLPGEDGEHPDLERLWDAARHADLIEVDGGRARGAQAPETGEDEAVLALWVALFDGVVTREFPEDAALSPLEVCQGELPSVLLHLYEHGTAAPFGELVSGLVEHVQDSYEIADAPTLAQGLPQALRLELDGLARWGALTPDGEGETALTPLGVHAVRELLLADGYTAPLIGDLAEGSAEELVGGLVHHREDTAEQEIGLWLAARSAAEAADGLLELMREGLPAQRNIAAVVLQQVGQDAEPLIRAALGARETRPYAAIWLNTHGDEETAPSEDDLQWMFVDTLAGMIEAVGPHDAVQVALADSEVDADLTALIENVWRLDHPHVGEVLEAVGEHHHDKELAKLARKAAFKARSK